MVLDKERTKTENIRIYYINFMDIFPPPHTHTNIITFYLFTLGATKLTVITELSDIKFATTKTFCMRNTKCLVSNRIKNLIHKLNSNVSIERKCLKTCLDLSEQ